MFTNIVRISLVFTAVWVSCFAEAQPCNSPEIRIAKEGSGESTKVSSDCDNDKQSTTNITVVVKNQENPQKQNTDARQNQDKENIKVQHRLAHLTAWLVIVGLIQAGILALTVCAIVGQIKAAKDSERAWILVNRVGSPNKWYDQDTAIYPSAIFEFKISGKTPAKIMDASLILRPVPVKHGISPAEPDLPPTFAYERQVKRNQEIPELGRVLAPEVIFQAQIILENVFLSEHEWFDLRDGKTIMCAYGFIVYRDAFKREKETRVCYVYNFSNGGVIKSIDGTVLNPPGFRIGGPTGYNHAT